MERSFFRHMLSSITSTIAIDEHDTTHESDFESILLMLPFTLLLGNIIRHLCVEFHISLPYTVILLIIGFCMGIGEYYTADSMGVLGSAILQIKTMSPHLLLGVFIPPLIFESAFGTDFHVIRREFLQALLLAGPGVLFNVAFTSIFCHYGLPYAWTWSEAISFSAIVSATDPVAVVALLRDLGASKRLATLIEGESLLNDGSAFVLFAIAIKFVVSPDDPPGGGEIVKDLCVLTFGGVATGIAFGICVVLWLRLVFNDERVEIVITLIACYLCFWFCENMGAANGNQMSGVLGTVFLGLFVSKYKSAISPSVEQSLHHFWEVVSYIANTLIFVFGGIIVVLGIIDDDRLTVSGSETDVITEADIGWLILLYIIIHIARFLTIMILWYPLRKSGYEISFQECIVLTFAGLRGVISLSLALIVKLSVADSVIHLVKYQDQTMFHVAGIVALTLAINGTFMRFVVEGLGLLQMAPDTQIILKDAMHHLRNENQKTINHLKGDTNYSGANWEQVSKTLPSYVHIIAQKDRKSTKPKPSCYYWCCQCSPCCFDNKQKDIRSEHAEFDKKGYKSLGTYQALKGRHNESKFITRRFGFDSPEHNENEQKLAQTDVELAPPKICKPVSTIEEEEKYESKQSEDENKNTMDVIPFTLTTLDTLDDATPFTRAFSVDLAPLEILKSQTTLEYFVPCTMTPIETAPDNTTKQLTKKQIEHRILQVLQRSFDAEYEEGNISLGTFMVLEDAVYEALGFQQSHQDIDDPDNTSLSVLKTEICKAFKINAVVKWAYNKCKNGLTQYFLLSELSLAIEVGLVFSASFQELPSKIELISVIRNNPHIGNVLTELHEYATEINNEWMAIHEKYPEVYTAIQTKHAVQTVIHDERHDILKLYNVGVLDESEKQRMTKLLLQTQHNIYFSAFYYVTSIYGTSFSQKQTLLSVLFMTKLNKDCYEQVIESLFDKIELKKWQQGQYIVSTHSRNADGIYIVVSGRCALLECGQFSINITRSEQEDDEDIVDKKHPLLAGGGGGAAAGNQHEMYLGRGSIIGGFEYLAGLKYLNPCIAKTDVIAYFIDNDTLSDLLNEEQAAYQCLWKQCATNLILAMYPKNDESFFRQYSKTQINNMCQKSQFISFDNDDVNKRKLLLNNFENMALILYGKCYYDVDIDNGTDENNNNLLTTKTTQRYNETEILFTHPEPYVFERYSKILILTIPKQSGNTNLRKRPIKHNHRVA